MMLQGRKETTMTPPFTALVVVYPCAHQGTPKRPALIERNLDWYRPPGP